MKQTQKILAGIFGIALVFCLIFSGDTFALDGINIGNVNQNTKESYFFNSAPDATVMLDKTKSAMPTSSNISANNIYVVNGWLVYRKQIILNPKECISESTSGSATLYYRGAAIYQDGSIGDIEVTFYNFNFNFCAHSSNSGAATLSQVDLARPEFLNPTSATYNINANVYTSASYDIDIKFTRAGGAVTLPTDVINIFIGDLDQQGVVLPFTDPWRAYNSSYVESISLKKGFSKVYIPNNTVLDIKNNNTTFTATEPTGDDPSLKSEVFSAIAATIQGGSLTLHWEGTDCGTYINFGTFAHVITAKVVSGEGEVVLKKNNPSDQDITTRNPNKTSIIQVPDGQTKEYIIKPDPGYTVGKIMVETESGAWVASTVQPVDNGDGTFTVTFPNNQNNQRIQVYFDKIPEPVKAPDTGSTKDLITGTMGTLSNIIATTGGLITALIVFKIRRKSQFRATHRLNQFK